MFDLLSTRTTDRNTFSEREWSLPPTETPPLGAHLVVPRAGYAHHGIYIGNGRVVHYSGLSRGCTPGPVEELSLAEFSRGRAISVRFHASPRFDRHGVTERARSRLGENAYQLLTNNCEHFSEWCVLGTSHSHQVDVVRQSPRRLLVGAMRALKRLREWLAIEPGSGGWAV